MIYDELLELGFSGIVGAAGVFVIADGKEIYHAYIDEEHRKSVYDYLEGNGFLFCYQADDGVVLNRRSSEGIVLRDLPKDGDERGAPCAFDRKYASDRRALEESEK